MQSKEDFQLYSAPGRVCLYGEHQDYLKLKVIPAAINLRTSVGIKRNNINKIRIQSIALNLSEEIDCLKPVEIQNTKLDYLRAIIKILVEKGKISTLPGFDVKISSDIPIGSGLSSSAAVLVAWLTALNSELELNLNKSDIAQLCFEAENRILNINCGIMDQYSSSLGGIFSLDCDGPPYKILELFNVFEEIVIGDSLTHRAANEPLTLLKNQLFNSLAKLKVEFSCNFKTLALDDLEQYKNLLTINEYSKLEGAINIRNATLKAEKELLKKRNHDLQYLGELLNLQQKMLRENLGVSTPKIDQLIKASLDAGAFGAKITGAGLGGSIIVFAPEREEKVCKAINSNGGRALKCTIDEGGRVDS